MGKHVVALVFAEIRSGSEPVEKVLEGRGAVARAEVDQGQRLELCMIFSNFG